MKNKIILGLLAAGLLSSCGPQVSQTNFTYKFDACKDNSLYVIFINSSGWKYRYIGNSNFGFSCNVNTATLNDYGSYFTIKEVLKNSEETYTYNYIFSTNLYGYEIEYR